MDRQFKNFLFDLILDNRKYDKLSEQYICRVEDLCGSDKNQFLQHLLQCDIERASEHFIDLISDLEVRREFLRLLKQSDIDNKIYLSDLMVEKMSIYYQDTMQSLIDDFLVYEEAA